QLSAQTARSSEVGAGLSGDLQTRSFAFKAVEETQKTWFLQWALYRLCESGINASAEFRNVLPVVMHDLVRRTAEMEDSVEAEIAKRVVEQEKTRQEIVRAQKEVQIEEIR